MEIRKGRIDVELSPQVMERRLAALPPLHIKVNRGYLKRYAEKAPSVSRGTVIED
jgi:dihydroxyacid dehydratase/phosphogluconate dehydratase